MGATSECVELGREGLGGVPSLSKWRMQAWQGREHAAPHRWVPPGLLEGSAQISGLGLSCSRKGEGEVYCGSCLMESLPGLTSTGQLQEFTS